jgi:hypothetical protein
MISAGERVDPAQRIWQPIRAGHLSDQRGGLINSDAGCGDIERPVRRAAAHGDRLGCPAESGLGDSYYGYLDRRVEVRPKTRPPTRVEIDVPVDEQQIELAHVGEHRAHGWQLAREEAAGLVGRDLS